MGCWSETDDGTATVLYYHGGVKKGSGVDQHTTEAVSQDKVDTILMADDGSIAGENPSATVTGEEAPALGATGEANSEQKAFVTALITMALVGMGLALFTTLAFGKIGISVLGNIFANAGFGAVDFAVMAINDEQLPGRNTIFKRALCWFAIGILGFLPQGLSWTSFDQKREGTVWQLEPLLYDSCV